VLVHVTGDATAGHWVWNDPVGSGVGLIQPEDDHTPALGTRCWATGNAISSGAGFNAADVDGGRTVLLSPTFDATGLTSPTMRYFRSFSNNAGPNGGTDTLHVQLSNNNGATWVTVESVRLSSPAWTERTFQIATYRTPTATMRLRFSIADRGADSTVEAAIDDIALYDFTVTSAAPPVFLTRLLPNLPNPFNPTTRLRWEQESSGAARLRIYDARGRLVRTLVDAWRPAGPHEQAWNGRDDAGHGVASGAYFVRLETGARTLSQRVMLVR
jgi:hypothetical protein